MSALDQILLIPGIGRRGVSLSQLVRELFSGDDDGSIYLAGPQYCYTDTSLTTKANENDDVAAFEDLSGKGRHIIQDDPDARGKLKRDLQGNWYVEFNGTSTFYYREEAWFYAAGAASFTIAMSAPTQLDKRTVAEGRSTSNNPTYTPIMSWATGGVRQTQFFRRDNNSASLAQDGNGPFMFVGRPLVATVTDSGINVTRHADQIKGTDRSYTRGATTLDRFAIGAFLRATPVNHTEMDFYGLIGTTYVPTGDQNILIQQFASSLIKEPFVPQGDNWAEAMLSSYMSLNAEQGKWFDTTEVSTIAERDALTPTMGQWCYVADVSGSSKEYVYDSNISEWVDAGIDGKSTLYSGSSGRACRAELLARLQSGQYLHDIYGPPGANRNRCDFVYLLLNSGDSVARRCDFSTPVRVDQDGTAVTPTTGSSGWPAYTIGANKGIITFSTIDPRRFGNITSLQPFEIGLYGACPSLAMPSVTGSPGGRGSINLTDNLFSGQMPQISVNAATTIRTRNDKFIGNLPGIMPTDNVVDSLSIFGLGISDYKNWVDFVYENRSLFKAISIEPELTADDRDQFINELLPIGKSPKKAFTDGDVGTAKHKLYELLKDPSEEAFQKWVSFVYSFDLSVEKTLILSFDDGFVEHATIVKDLFDTKGVKNTQFITVDFVDTAGKMTQAQIKSLYDAGYDIQDHSKTHTAYNTLTEAQLIAEFEAVDALFATMEIPKPRYLAYPFGSSNTPAQIITKEFGRTIARGIGNSDFINKSVNLPFNLPSARSLDNATVSSGYITTLNKLDSGVMVFYGHGVYVDDAAESAYPNPTKLSVLSDIIDHCQANGIAIKTFSDVFDDRCWYGID